VCVPYTAVVPLLLLVVRWFLSKLASFGLVPESVVTMMNLQDVQQQQQQQTSSTCCVGSKNKEGGCNAGASSSSSSSSSSAVRHVSTESEFESLLRDYETVVVKFTATWCQPCKNIQPFYERQAVRYCNGDASVDNDNENDENVVAFVSIDVDELEGITNRYSVAMMPTFLVLGRNGRVVGTYRGSSEPHLETFLTEHLATKVA
jgi:thioredoxin 1